jgi:plasmid stabilization system protein ParE
MRIVWAEQARQEREAQYRFYLARNPDAARRMRTRVRERLDWLRQTPKGGRPGHVQGTRELVIPGTPWVIVYQENPVQIEIVHFFHGRQDWQQ